MTESKNKSEDYTFSLELKTPDALSIIRDVLNSIEESNEEINRIQFKIESEEPFNKHAFLRESNLKYEKSDKDKINSSKKNYSKTDLMTLYPPDTSIFIISSVLLHEDTPLIVDEIVEKLEDTEWEISRKQSSKILRSFLDEDIIIRNRRDTDSIGSNPYEYELTDSAKSQVKSVEQQIKQKGDEKTYEDIKPISYDYKCEICGEDFQTGGGLGSHKYFKHSEKEQGKQNKLDETEETDGESKDVKEISIKPGTNRFYSISVLYNSAKPVVPRDIENRLEDTEWGLDRSSISAVLGKLNSEGLVAREQRLGEHGNPYEYELTKEGEERVEDAIKRARDEGEKTFEDVVAGK